MSDPAAAGQVLLAGYPAGDPPASILESLAEDALAGVILFKRNLADGPAGAAEQIRALARAARRTPLVAVDQEGAGCSGSAPPSSSCLRCAGSASSTTST